MSAVIFYDGEWMPYKELENVYVSKLSDAQLAKVIQKYNRLRNAVYVTYPYARTAGVTLRDVAAHLDRSTPTATGSAISKRGRKN